MSLLTNWGYSIEERDTIPTMMDSHEYETFTGRKDNDERVYAEIKAACAAVRNFVGWHLYPDVKCKLKSIITDDRISFTGRDMLIQLPARYVTGVESITIGGEAHTHFAANPNGLLRVYDVRSFERYAQVVIIYTAGLPAILMDPIKELIAHRVTHSIAVPPGITSEASGGVSVTYNAGWINNSRATALAGDNKELLVPYKVQGVF